MRPDFDVEKITAGLASAALDSSRWVEAMEILSASTGSFGAAMFPVVGPLPFVPASRSLEPSFEAYINAGWIHRDERYRGISKLLSDGIFTDFDFISDQEIKKHPYYQEFLAPHRLNGFAGVKIGTDQNVSCISIQRTFEQGPFSRSELRTLKQLSTRLGSIAATAEALAFARGESALSTFDISGKAALLLNRRGEIVRLNIAAEKLVGSDTDIRIANRRLLSWNRDANDQLDAAIKQLVWTRKATSVRPVIFPRVGRGSIVIYGMRAAELTDSPFSQFSAILVLADPDSRSGPAISTLHAVFGLTHAEARLAVALAAGQDLSSEAEQLGVSRETVRSQLKNIFAKTGTRRQAELAAMLSRLLADK